MHRTGLVSVSFRSLSPEQVVLAAAAAGLNRIEWGSDIHAPCGDPERIRELTELQKKYGILCSSYGTYFRLGVDAIEGLAAYIAAAKQLGTTVLRLWCGNRSAEQYTQEAREQLLADCRAAVAMAEKAGVCLCMECHIGTYTETKEGALELMEAVASPAFRMYWQPNQYRTVEENLAGLRLLKPYVEHIHVFQWKGQARFPLRSGLDEWKGYLQELNGSHTLLLEFMPDDRPESLPEEVRALNELVGG